MPTPESPEQALLVHDGFVRALARSLLADKDAAEDVAQEAWVAALERGTAAASLPQWLAGVVRKRAGKHLRAQARRARREREVARGEGTPSGEEILEREALRARVVAAVLALEEPYREAVLLRFFENLPPRAIAARLGVPVETVRTRLKRALEKLRARLDREHGGRREAWSLALLPWALPLGGGVAAPTSFALTKLALGAAGLALAVLVAARMLPAPPSEPPLASSLSPGKPASENAADAPEAPPTAPERVALAPTPAAASVAANSGSLRVAVRWSDGSPAAAIRARFESWALESPRFRAREALTDESGSFLLEDLRPGKGWVTLDRDLTASVEIEVGVEAALALELPRGFDVEGHVVDASGAPVGGAELWLSDINSFTGTVVGSSRPDGRFELRSCSKGQELGAFAPGHAPSLLASLGAEEGTRVSVRLVLLGAGGEVVGSVRGPSGEPVADAHVLVGSEQREFRRVFVAGEGELVGTIAPAHLVRTDIAGRFRARGVAPGRVPVVVRAAGFATWRSELTLAVDVPGTLVAELVPEAVLVGRVLDEQGAPLELARVQLGGRFGLLDPEVTTASDGVYRLGGLAPGRNVIQVRVSKAGSTQATFELAAGEERVWDPVIGLGLALAGRVLDESGAPLRGWSLDVIGELRSDSPSHGSARTDAEGRFLVKSLEDMPYRLRLEAPGISVPVLELGGLRPGKEERVIRVPASRFPSARVRGSVVEASGSVPANLALELATANLGLPSEIDAQGRFELGPLVPATYVLRVRAQGQVEHVLGPRQLAANETWDLGVVVLEPAGSLVVRALRPPGTETLAPWFRVQRASDDGRFELGPVEAVGAGWRREALAPGRYALTLGGRGVASAQVPFELHAGEELTLEVPLRPGLQRELHVRTSTELGARQVRLGVLDAGGALVIEDELWPNFPGDYRAFWSFAPGLYRVVAELTDGPRVEGELSIGPGEFLPLVLELR